MNDGVWMIFLWVAVIASLVLVLIIGGGLEKDRIYKNCLETNKTMIHQDAVKLCKDIVK